MSGRHFTNPAILFLSNKSSTAPQPTSPTPEEKHLDRVIHNLRHASSPVSRTPLPRRPIPDGEEDLMEPILHKNGHDSTTAETEVDRGPEGNTAVRRQRAGTEICTTSRPATTTASTTAPPAPALAQAPRSTSAAPQCASTYPTAAVARSSSGTTSQAPQLATVAAKFWAQLAKLGPGEPSTFVANGADGWKKTAGGAKNRSPMRDSEWTAHDE